MFRSATRPALSIAALAATFALFHAAPALALGPVKAWVSNSGVDSGTCGGFTTPCATFQQAHDNVTAGGDIGVLTPGNYGGGFTFAISKSINVTNDGVGEATVIAPVALPAIVVQAGAGDVVSLRGLVIDGVANVQNSPAGIDFRSGSALHMQNCVIRNFQKSGVAGNSGVGILFEPSGNSLLVATDTVVFNNGTVTATGGIIIQPLGTGSANVILDRLHLENNVRGLWVDGSQGTGNGAHVVIRDSVASANANDGILATSAPGKAPAFIVVEHGSAVNNAGTGIHADGPRATILLNDNTITRNGTGISATNSGQLISYGNNKNNNNVGPEGAPTGFFSQM